MVVVVIKIMREGNQLKNQEQGSSKAMKLTLSCVFLHRKLTGFQIVQTFFDGPTDTFH